jgi:hypothetical protein
VSALRPNVCRCGSTGGVLETRDCDGARRRRFSCSSCGERWSTVEMRIPEGIQFAGRGPNSPSFIWLPGCHVESVRKALRLLLDNLGTVETPQEGP